MKMHHRMDKYFSNVSYEEAEFALQGCFIFTALALMFVVTCTSKTPYVAIDERGLVRSIHLFLFSCVH